MKSITILLASLLIVVAPGVQATDSDQYLEEAKRYLQEEKTDAAVIQLKNALQQNPENIEARLLLGKIYIRTGDGVSAEKEIERAVRLKASKELWQVDLGQSYLLQRKYDQIISAIEPDPTLSGTVQAGVYNLRGQAFLATGAINEAREAFQQALSSQPEYEQAELGMVQVTVASGNTEEGHQQLDAFLLKHPENVQARILRSELLRRQKKIEEALVDLDYVIQKDANNLVALLGRTTLNLQLAKYDLASKDLEVLNKIAAKSPVVLYLNGVSAFQQRKIKEAEEYIQQVLKLIPNHPQSQLIYGAILFNNGEYLQADEYLSQTLAAIPGHLPTIKLLAATRIKMRQFEKAVSVLEDGLASDPEDVQIIAMLGNVYLQTGRFDEGSELLAKAVDKAPDLASLRTQLAFGLLARGETKGAIDELQSAVDLGQELIQADVLLVLSHIKNNQFEQALKASQALESRSPDNPLAYNLTGLAYLASGDETKARERFLKALEKDPSFVTAQINLARIELSHNRLDEAETIFLDILKKAPDNLTALLAIAGIEERRNNREGMYGWLSTAQQKNPKSSKPGVLMTQAYLRDGENLKALRAARETVTSFPNDPEVLRVLGTAQIAAGEDNSAIQSFKQLVIVQNTPQNLALLANTLTRVENHKEARANIRLALEIEPDYLPALSTLGNIALQENSFDEAMEIAKRIQSSHSQQSVGYRLEALTLLKQQKGSEAIAPFEKAYQVQKSADLALQLSHLYRQQGDQQKSLEPLVDWLQFQPGDVRTRSVYATLLQQYGNNDKAMAEYETILQQSPDNILVLNNLAWLYQLNNDRRAIELSERAFQLAPDKPEIVDTYGWILVNFGDYEKGLAYLKDAFAKMPENPEVAFHVGYALSKSGNKEEAKKVLRRIVRDHKESPYAEKAKALELSLD